MSTNDKARSSSAKDSASDNGVSKKASAGGRKDSKGKAGKFSVLPKSAGLDQSLAYMEKHTGAIVRSIGMDLCSSWCVGYELIRVKAKLGLKGQKWDAYCKKTLPFSSRQARDYKALAKAYGSAEKTMKGLKKPEKKGISFANAVLQARVVLNPVQEPEPNSGNKHDRGQNENEPVTIEPYGAGSPPVDCPTPASDSDGPGMLDDIQRIAANLADDLVLMGKVHAILVKAEAKAARNAVSTKGRGASKAKAKSRKPAAKKKRGKAA